MDYKEALEYINKTEWFGSRPGLERITELLEKLGNPQNGMKFIHIAGTNGKGSCAAMTASVLKAAGYKTGLFTSPYLYRFNERMQINGKQIDDDVLAADVSLVKIAADAMADHPTEFELITAAAMVWFKEQNCDIVVLEVGLGGRLDATNVIEAPEACVIMNIGLDHTAVLGDTVEQIAEEKAGIIKPGADCVLYQQSQSVTEIVRERCDEVGARLHVADFSELHSEFDSLFGQSFTYRGEVYALPLLGANQLRNAAVVLELVEVLRRRGWALDQSDVEHGLYAVSWPGRFELVNDEPCFIVDGGHNPQCAQALAASLRGLYGGKKLIFLIGVLADKDWQSMVGEVLPLAKAIVTVRPESDRAKDENELAAWVRAQGVPAEAHASIGEALDAVLALAGPEDAVCAWGSLYSVGELRHCLGLC